MSLPKYPRYKDSGVEWLGEVPEHWQVKRIRLVAAVNPSKSEIQQLDKATPVSFLPMESIGEDGRIEREREKPISEVESGYTYFRDGDVVLAKITPCFENRKGAFVTGLTNGVGFGSTELIVARPRTAQVDGLYLNLLFQSHEFRSLGEARMYGAGGQKRVPESFVRDFETAFPPITDQLSIVAFVNRETAKIEVLIAEQQRLIELLKEKRQAVISHAVTRGLDRDAPMLQSNVEVLAGIPYGWQLAGMTKYLRSVVDYRGRTPTKVEDGIFLLTARNIRDGSIDYSLSKEFIDPVEYESTMRRGVPALGDVVFTTEAPLGQVANLDRTDIAIAQRVIKFSGVRGVLDDFFLKYWIMGSYCQAELMRLATGSTAVGIKGSKLGQIPLLLPPIAEQTAIVRFLDATTRGLDALVIEAEHAIALLKERRTALISAAVTGKIDVRNLVGAA